VALASARRIASRTAANASGRISSSAASICCRSRLCCSLRSSLMRVGSPTTSSDSAASSGRQRALLDRDQQVAERVAQPGAELLGLAAQLGVGEATYSGSSSLMRQTVGSKRRTSRSFESVSLERNFSIREASISGWADQPRPISPRRDLGSSGSSSSAWLPQKVISSTSWTSEREEAPTLSPRWIRLIASPNSGATERTVTARSSRPRQRDGVGDDRSR
jgi:hypothetical protein